MELKGNFDYTNFENLDNYWKSYEGHFIEGEYTGEGILFLSNGDKFWGQFKKGYVDGHGIYYPKSEKEKVKGVWEKNILVRTLDDEELDDPDVRDIFDLIS